VINGCVYMPVFRSVLTVNIICPSGLYGALISSSLDLYLMVDSCRSVNYATYMSVIIAGIKTEEVGWGRGGVMLMLIKSLAV